MRTSIACFLLSFLFCVSACQQGKTGSKRGIYIKEIPPSFSYPPWHETIMIEEPFKVGSLSGVVSAPNGYLRPLVLVERMDGGWEERMAKRIEATFTDPKGRFSFPDAGPGTYFLRLSYPGFEWLEVTVEVIEGSREELDLELYM